MRLPDAKEIRELTRKLKEEGDITLKEADRIFSLFSATSIKTRLNIYSPKGDYELVVGLAEWFRTVSCKIEDGARGNFIYTIFFDDDEPVKEFMPPARNAIKKYGTFEDLCVKIMMDQKTYLSLPEELRKLFVSNIAESHGEKFYVLRISRAGFYHYRIKELRNADSEFHTIKQFMEKFSPVMELTPVVTHWVSNGMGDRIFEIASGAREICPESWILGGRQTSQYVIAAFMRRKEIPCMAMNDINRQSIIFTGKEDARIVEKVKEIPFKELVTNALKKGVINQKMAKGLLNNNPIRNFPIVEFIDTSMELIDDVVNLKMEWEARQEAVEAESAWMDETQ